MIRAERANEFKKSGFLSSIYVKRRQDAITVALTTGLDAPVITQYRTSKNITIKNLNPLLMPRILKTKISM